MVLQPPEALPFTTRAFEYFIRMQHRHKGRVSVLAILADGDESWRPTDYEGEVFGQRFMHFTFPIIKLLDYVPELNHCEENLHPIANVVAIHLRALQVHGNTELTYTEKMRLTKKFLQLGHTTPIMHLLWEFIHLTLGLPPALQDKFIQEIEQFEKENNLSYLEQMRNPEIY